MKNIVVINPVNKGIDYSFKEIQMEEIPFKQEEIINSNHPERSIHDFLQESIIKLQQSNGILISCNCDWKISTNIILYLRLNEKWNLGSHPIIWDSKKELSEILLLGINEKFHNSFIPNDLTHFIDRRLHNSINSEIESHFLSDNNDLFSLEQITVKPYKSSGHQITNEWGAFKLAYTAGFYHLLSMIEEQQEASRTLYFNYLKRKYINYNEVANTEGVVADNNPTKKYLLIDDNYDKGWKLVFAEILKQANLSLDAFEEIKNISEENEERLIEEIKTKIKDADYQGILLDLRLTASDNSKTKSNTNITDFTGGRILKALKREFPYLPIIIVTASNKAWNMRQLLDGGADGYFIKEDPESNPSEEISINTYEAFVELIKTCQEKYKTLAPFWAYINDVKTNPTLITERDGSVVQERIRERLEMFFGLLKRSFEDSEYNGRFHYSDKTLAFMTLWSCLNDIQYIFYDKTETHADWLHNNKQKHNIKIEESLCIERDLLDSNRYLQKRTTETKSNSDAVKKQFKSFLKYSGNSYSIEMDELEKDYSGSIGEQIAFLILTLSGSQKVIDEASNQISPSILCNNLANLKTKRNHIYLTHGNEEIGSSFFLKEEKEKTEIDEQDCARMFEIIFFLLRGIYVRINV